jgi:hypothetical protein
VIAARSTNRFANVCCPPRFVALHDVPSPSRASDRCSLTARSMRMIQASVGGSAAAGLFTLFRVTKNVVTIRASRGLRGVELIRSADAPRLAL